MTTTQITLTEFTENAKQAYYWSSFNPENRGQRTIQEFEKYLYEDLKSIPDHWQEKYIAKFKMQFSAWLSSLSRCASAAVTGPANFPVERMQKNNQAEHNKLEAFTQWRQKVTSAFVRQANKAAKGTELEEARKDLENRLKRHEIMKASNAICRKHKGQISAIPELMALGMSEKSANEILHPKYANYSGYAQTGYAAFYLTNNLAAIKRLQERVKMLEQKEAIRVQVETGETEIKLSLIHI